MLREYELDAQIGREEVEDEKQVSFCSTLDVAFERMKRIERENPEAQLKFTLWEVR